MKDIIPPVPLEALKDELTSDRFIRKTNKGGNKIYIINAENAPNTMREIGRLRELSFRAAGGGTGLDCDLDEFDTGENSYQQLIVWDPEEKAILGGYRFYICESREVHERWQGAACHIKIIRFFRPVHSGLSSAYDRAGPFLCSTQIPVDPVTTKGIICAGQFMGRTGNPYMDYPHKKYMFGKVTMYLHYHQMARDMILFFLNKHFPDNDGLVIPKEPLKMATDRARLTAIFTGQDYAEDYKILSREVRACGENIPPLINAYMNLSPSMRTFGTVLNKGFGDVEETGIMITLNDLYKAKVERHVMNYVPKQLRKIKNIRRRDLKLARLTKRFHVT